MAKVTTSPVAIEDMRLIHGYISNDSQYYADKVIERIVDRISILEEHTHIGKVVKEFQDSSIRELIEAPYRIIYKIMSEDEISVVHIYHGARLLKKI